MVEYKLSKSFRLHIVGEPNPPRNLRTVDGQLRIRGQRVEVGDKLLVGPENIGWPVTAEQLAARYEAVAE